MGRAAGRSRPWAGPTGDLRSSTPLTPHISRLSVKPEPALPPFSSQFSPRTWDLLAVTGALCAAVRRGSLEGAF